MSIAVTWASVAESGDAARLLRLAVVLFGTADVAVERCGDHVQVSAEGKLKYAAFASKPVRMLVRVLCAALRRKREVDPLEVARALLSVRTGPSEA